MEPIPLDEMSDSTASSSSSLPIAPDPTDYKKCLASAIQAVTTHIHAPWEYIDTVEGGLQLSADPMNGSSGIRLAGRVRGSLTHWRSLFLDHLELFERYDCREEQSVIQVFVFSTTSTALFGATRRAAGVYQVYEQVVDKSVRIIYATHDIAAHLHPPAIVNGQEKADGILGVYLKEVELNECELHLITWPDFHLSTLSTIWHFGLFASQREGVGREIARLIATLEAEEGDANR